MNTPVQTIINTPVQITVGTDAIPGDILKFSIIDSPQYGAVTSPVGKPLNSIIYAPNTGFTGKDRFTYKFTYKSDGKEVDSSIHEVIITVGQKTPKTVHILWVIVAISLIGALYLAYFETTSKSALDTVLPKTNITISLENVSTTVTKTSHKDTFLSAPQIPRFIFLWGYIGSAAYLLKVVTGFLGEGNYKNSYLPFHISRLFIGPALAIVFYFILQTGSFFGLSFDVTKVPIPLLPYLYAGMAFITGYFVRPIIETLSKIINAIFNIK
jgi:hypothetical protein